MIFFQLSSYSAGCVHFTPFFIRSLIDFTRKYSFFDIFRQLTVNATPAMTLGRELMEYTASVHGSVW